MTTKRSLAFSGLFLVVALTGAGCGGQPFPQAKGPTASVPRSGSAAVKVTPQARLLASVQRTTDEKTARISLKMAISGFASGFASGRVVTATGSGVMDLTKKQMMLKLEEQASGENDTAEIRMVGGTVYLNEGNGWTAQPYAATDTSTPDPSGELDYLQGASANVRVVGHAVVRGADTTRYAATLDLKRALTRARGDAQRSALLHAIAVLGDLQIPVSAWIDDAGRLRKMQLSMDLGAAARKLGAPTDTDPKITETLELYDFGVPVDVQAPVGAKSAITVAQDHAAQSDLRNALTAEKTTYTDNMTYSNDVALLKQIEPTLNWGGKLKVVVGDSSAGSSDVVCLSEQSKSGTVFSIGDVSEGSRTGTYYGKKACPAVVNDVVVSGLGTAS